MEACDVFGRTERVAPTVAEGCGPFARLAITGEEPTLSSPVFGEMMGTFVLILLGDGVVAGVLLKQSKGENAGWLAITAGWAFAVLAGVFAAIASGSTDAHRNPATTVASALSTGHVSTRLPYWSAQLVGAFLGAVVVWVHYGPHWAITANPDVKLGTFCTM